MSPQTPNIAARAGRWSARHRKTAIFGWIAFVLVAFTVGGAVGTKTIDDAHHGTGESGRADVRLAEHFKQPAAEQVLVQSRTDTVSDPVVQRAIADVAQRLEHTPDVRDVRSPVGSRGDPSAISRDRHSALVTFAVAGPKDTAPDRIGPARRTIAAAAAAHPGVHIAQFGDASAAKAFDKAFEDDFAKARTLSLPITLIILIVAFGALVAAGIPVVLAISGVMSTLGLVAVASHVAAVDQSVAEVVLLVGMAVGVDYSLFYMRREREERSAGRDEDAALQAAAATSGRSVLISGLTVMVSMAGMYFAGDPTFTSFATGTILVVAVAVLASLTVLPALLSLLGDRVMKGRVPFLAKRREAGRESRIWAAVLGVVTRRPWTSTIVAGGLLVALAIPFIGMHTASPGAQGLPQNLPETKTLNRIQAAFPGGAAPAQVVVSARDVTAPGVAGAIGRLRHDALASPRMGGPVEQRVSPDHTVAVVSIPLAGKGTDNASDAALRSLREDLVPRTVGQVDGVRTEVTGRTAASKDFDDATRAHLPIVVGFVLLMAFTLLLMTFRSLTIALTAIVLNLLSVGASYGVLVLVFQHGVGESLLDFHSTGAITSWLPMFLFVILFGLSMDYHVFILSRIREGHEQGLSTREAVAQGINRTAGVVTSAAIVMVAVFGIFASLGSLEFKQMGVGLATAILLDATLVRGVLLPSVMTLLGERNWYLPRALHWLPEVRTEASAGAPATAGAGAR